VQESVVDREVVAMVKATQMIGESVLNERLPVPTLVQRLLLPSGESSGKHTACTSRRSGS
jgi:hypothetical protein